MKEQESLMETEKSGDATSVPKMGRIYRRHRLKRKETAKGGRGRSKGLRISRDTRSLPIEEASPMFFRLRFSLPQGSVIRPSWAELSAFLVNLDNTLLLPEIKDIKLQNPQYEYYNSDTRAYAKFFGYKAEKPDELGLCFELSLPCPHVFALECLLLPLVVVREFKLRLDYVPCALAKEEADEQGYALKSVYGSVNPSLEELMAVWSVINKRARQIWECVHGPSPVYRRSFLECVWEYRTIAPVLRSRYSKGKMKRKYCELEFYQDESNRQVFTMCEWNLLEPAAFPIADRIRLHGMSEYGLDGKIIDARAFFSEGKTWLKKMSTPIKHYYTRENQLAARKEMLSFLADMPDLTPESFSRVAYQRLEDS